MTNLERIKAMTIEEMATFLSETSHTSDYEEGDYDPAVMEWLQNKAD